MQHSAHLGDTYSLTERERQILHLIAGGNSDREIADLLYLSVGTVKWYNRQIYSKLGVRNRTEASSLYHSSRSSAPSSSVISHPSAVPVHIPVQITSFIGRTRELDELRLLVESSRLLTLTGPPGTGKTRLAQRLALNLSPLFPDGVYFISLAVLSDPEILLETIIQNLEIQQAAVGDRLDSLKSYLRRRRLLLVLDNFEHLLPAAPRLSTLLQATSGLKLIVTSREALRLYGEQEYVVNPLPVPEPDKARELNEIGRFSSVELFVQRARATIHGFQLNAENAEIIAQICARLDGLPLAIELAAARLRLYSPQSLLARLSNRLDTLGDGPRDKPMRQRTLRSTLAWSYDLLDPDEQRLFRYIGVFSDGCSVDDIQAICDGDLQVPVAEGLGSLLNKNLIQRDFDYQMHPRFNMLPTMQEYALYKLEEEGALEEIRSRHLIYFADLAHQAQKAFNTPEEKDSLQLLDLQYGNLRQALTISMQVDGQESLGIRLAASLAHFWEVKGYFREIQYWHDRMRTLPDWRSLSREQAEISFCLGLSLVRQGKLDQAESCLQVACDIYEQQADLRALSYVLVRYAEVLSVGGRFEESEAMCERAYDITRQLNDPLAHANVVCQIGFDRLRFGEFELAARWLNEALAVTQNSGDDLFVALTYSGLAELKVRLGELSEAEGYIDKSIRIRDEMGNAWGMAASLGTKGWIAMIRGDIEESCTLLKRSIEIRAPIAENGGIAWCLERYADICMIKQELELAVMALGLANKLREMGGFSIDPIDEAHYEELGDSLMTSLGEETFWNFWDDGAAMDVRAFISQVWK